MSTDTTIPSPESLGYSHDLAVAAEVPTYYNLHPVMIEWLRLLPDEPQTALAIAFSKVIAARVAISLNQPNEKPNFRTIQNKAYGIMLDNDVKWGVTLGFVSGIILHTIISIIDFFTRGSALVAERPGIALCCVLISSLGLSLFFTQVAHRGVSLTLRAPGDNFHLNLRSGHNYNFLLRLVKRDRCDDFPDCKHLVFAFITKTANRIIRNLTHGHIRSATGIIPTGDTMETVRKCIELHYFDSEYPD